MNIMVLGSFGSGKSTLAQKLADKFKLRFVNLDFIYWKPDWNARNANEAEILMAKAIEKDGWVCDGNCPVSFEQRVTFADYIIWLDFGRIRCLYNILKREFKYKGKVRPDLQSKEFGDYVEIPWDWGFYKHVWNFHKNDGKAIEKLFAEYGGHGKLIRISEFSKLDGFAEEFLEADQ